MTRFFFIPIAALVLLVSEVNMGLPWNGLARRGVPNINAPTSRKQLLLDFGWKFHLGDVCSVDGDQGYGSGATFAKAGEAYGAAQPDFPDSAWRRVDLPHDWAVELDFVRVDNDDMRNHGFKPVGRQFPKTSIGWYRRSFVIPKTETGERIALRFDGVFRDCIVWFNGHYLGGNPGGYSEFGFDISDYILSGGKNVLVVRVDASQYEGWFYEGAGIYRHAWLITYAPVHISDYGVFVSSIVRESEAVVDVRTDVTNDLTKDAHCVLHSVILDSQGKVAGEVSSEAVTFRSGERRMLHQQVRIDNPLLWSLESPHLYALVSLLESEGKPVDRLETPFGIRTVRFDKEQGFFLNGKRVEIKGVCCHQDHAGVGSALPDRLQYYRVERLKEMGCNAYRTSHNPPTRELLDACDRLGMLVMDENRLMGSSPELIGEFRELILRDRNHPSVIIWSLGNEEWMIQGTETGKRIATSLKRVQQELDPTRVCTYAANNGNEFEGINSVVDVRGINYIVLGDPDKYHQDHPDQPVWGSEEASTLCTRGIYANDTVRGFMSDYDVNAPRWGSIAEKWWKFYAARSWLAGAFVWTGFDYRGEPTPYSWPCINSHFGIMDVCGFPKNNYFYYQSWWSDRDVLHLSPHWNWKGREGQPIDVWCQSNCDSVELSLNGKNLGRKTMERNSHLEWKVPYEPGVLEARGFRSGRLVTTRIETTGDPARLVLEPDRTTILGNGEDVSVVNVSVLDQKGREVPVADNRIRFEADGSGRIIGVGNGNPSSHEADKYISGKYMRRAFNGKCQVILQSSRRAGTIELRAVADGLSPAAATIRVEASAPRPFVED